MRNSWQRQPQGDLRTLTCCKFFSVDFCRSYCIYNQLQIYKCPSEQVLVLHVLYLFTLFSSSTPKHLECLEVLCWQQLQWTILLLHQCSEVLTQLHLTFWKTPWSAGSLSFTRGMYVNGLCAVLETNQQNHQNLLWFPAPVLWTTDNPCSLWKFTVAGLWNCIK